MNDLCEYYKCLNKENKRKFIIELACKYSIQHKDVCTVANTLVSDQCNECQNIRLQEKLKTALTPKYKWLFIHIGRQENGVKFLVDMRTDVLVSKYLTFMYIFFHRNKFILNKKPLKTNLTYIFPSKSSKRMCLMRFLFHVLLK